MRVHDRPHIRKRRGHWQVVMLPPPRWELPHVHTFASWADLWAAFEDGREMQRRWRR